MDSEVFRADNLMLLLVPDMLLPLAIDPVGLPPRTESLCAARLPSLIATAVCCFDLV